MNREIKFRIYSEAWGRMIYRKPDEMKENDLVQTDLWHPMQFTGLLDKNGLKEVYEGDIIDVEGNIKGNIYENNKKTTDFVIQGFGTKDWEATNKEALERGCKYSQ